METAARSHRAKGQGSVECNFQQTDEVRGQNQGRGRKRGGGSFDTGRGAIRRRSG